MNVIVIPFFLAANLVVKDQADWKFGPEYSYNVSINYDMKQPLLDESTIHMDVNCTTTCRPKDPETLLCQLRNIMGEATVMGRKISQNDDTELTFGIKFSERGVEAVLDEASQDIRALNIIRKIANQLSMNARLIRAAGSRPISRFTERENTTMGNCMTTYEIKQEEQHPNTIQPKDTNFQFQVLPSRNIRPGTTLSIGMERTECTDIPEKLEIFELGIFRMERFNATIRIDDTYKSVTEVIGFPGSLNPKNNKSSPLKFMQRIELSLDTIKPAREELPAFDGKVVQLNTKFTPKEYQT